MKAAMTFDLSAITETVQEMASLPERLPDPPQGLVDRVIKLLENGDVWGAHDPVAVGAGVCCLRCFRGWYTPAGMKSCNRL